MFAVFNDVLGFNETTELTQAEFNAIGAVRKVLDEINDFEERFWIVCELYRELEETCMKTALNYAIYHHYDETDHILARSLIGMRVASFLSASRLYLDTCGSSAVKITLGKVNDQEAKKFTSDAYDNNFEYRFCCYLRDYAVHNSIPVHGMAIDLSRNVELDLVDHKVYFSIPLAPLIIWAKREKNFRKELVGFSNPSFDLKIGIRKYFSLICEIHEKIRKVISDCETSAENQIANARLRHTSKKLNAEALPGLCVCELDDQGLKIAGVKTIYLSVSDDKVREIIQLKTSSMVGIEKRRILSH